ncbi:MAG: hypothetical protein AB1478_10495, partial [Nitrospirota bacterium]
NDVVFAGGCANNGCLKEMLEQSTGKTIKVASIPEITGALGAALYAETIHISDSLQPVRILTRQFPSLSKDL